MATIGVLQGDGLSPKLFTIYLNEALNQIGSKNNNPSLEDHRYGIKASHFNTHEHDSAKSNVSNLARHWDMQMMQTFSAISRVT